MASTSDKTGAPNSREQALWTGRFKKQLSTSAHEFNASIGVDKMLYREDITGSIAHVSMLGECGIIDKNDSATIANELEKILSELNSGTLHIDNRAEDIHSFVEGELTKRIGDLGKKLHTARSRNDQVALDLKLYLRGNVAILQSDIKAFITVLTDIAEQHAETILPGYTHLQRAQSVTLGHHFCAYCAMLMRDYDRLSDALKRIEISPLGAGALAGTTYPINSALVAKTLGFKNTFLNSLDAVSDRDHAIEVASNIAILMMHLSRFAEEVIIWNSAEFKFIELSDEYATGSSMMPQKKNPDIAELVRGKTGRTYGNLMTLLTIMKALPLAYNKDMQEDKEAIFDSITTAHNCLTLFKEMIATANFNTEKMHTAAQSGFLNATDCADYLVKKGVPFRDAYKTVGELVSHCVEHNIKLEDLSLEQLTAIHPAFDKDIYGAMKLESCVKNRKNQGGTSPASVKKQIALIRKFLAGA